MIACHSCGTNGVAYTSYSQSAVFDELVDTAEPDPLKLLASPESEVTAPSFCSFPDTAFCGSVWVGTNTVLTKAWFFVLGRISGTATRLVVALPFGHAWFNDVAPLGDAIFGVQTTSTSGRRFWVV